MKTDDPANKALPRMRKCAIVIILLLNAIFAAAQTPQKVSWTKLSKNRGATFYDVQKDFNGKWKGKLKEMAREKRRGEKEKAKAKGKETGEEQEEAGGLEVYKRWESYMAPRVYPSGDMGLPGTNYANFMTWKKAYGLPLKSNSAAADVNSISNASNWTILGPVGSPSGPSPYSRTGAGRVNFIKFDPKNPGTYYIGTPDGGLWKSTDAGGSWTTNTDFLPVIGCSDLAIDPGNTNNMYLATGDIEGNKVSIGVLKSTDGGLTWNNTAVTWPASDQKEISKLLMNPSDPLNMIIATNDGIYRTTDGWATYTQTQCCVAYKDMKFKPGDPNTVYAAGSSFWKSTDNGITWAQIKTGLPATNVERIAIGVTAANPAYVYALIGKASDESFLGMFRSADSGNTFSKRSSSPNLLAYAPDGSDRGGQAFYDLSILVSPTDPEIVTTGGVNHWQSADGGKTWTNKSVWDAGQIHADVHGLEYLPGSSITMFSCNDGGIFRSDDNGTNWTDLSHNLTIGQVVGFGSSANVESSIVEGEQDNGTNLRTGTAWHNIFGGDGGVCFIDYNNNNTIYVQYVQGDFNRSDDGGATTTTITNGLNADFDFYSEWHQDPVTPSKLYVAGNPRLYVSNDKGNNWSALGTPPGSGSIVNFVIAPSNPAIMYAVKRDLVSKSTDGGVTFTNITGTLPSDAALSNIEVSDTDPNKIWVTYSGYSQDHKVYRSVDGGATWTNISAGLPNLPVNTLISQRGSVNDAVYLGADIGIYYFDNTLSSWVPFMTNLPHSAIRQLEIYYPTGKIRAATYGRSNWESNLYNANPLPAISYSGPQSYFTGYAISPLAPIVSGVTAFGYNSSALTAASGFADPQGVAADAAGNIYVADRDHNAVKKIPAAGGAAIKLGAGFNKPTGIAVDPAGNVYVADKGNNAVKKIPAGGSAAVVLSAGFNSPSGLAVDVAGNVYVVDASNSLYKLAAGGGSPVVLATGLNNPGGVAVDPAGNIYVADTGNKTIKEFPSDSSPEITFGGGFTSPQGLASDNAGNIYVTDGVKNDVYFIAAGGQAAPVAIGIAGLNNPYGIAANGAGNLYIADAGNNAVKKIVPEGGYFISPALPAGLSFDSNAGIISGLPLVGSPATNYTITAYNPTGKSTAQLNITVKVTQPPALSYSSPQMYTAGNAIAPLAPSNSGGPTGPQAYKKPVYVGAGFKNPKGVAVDAAGNVFIADAGNNAVKKIPSGGGAPVSLAAGFKAPSAVAVDAAGNLYIADAGHNAIKKIAVGGGAPVLIKAGFNNPSGVAVDAQGNVYVTDASGGLYEIPAGGGPLVTLISGFNNPNGVAVDAAGNIFIADTDDQWLLEYPADGSQGIILGSGFIAPTGVALDAAGNVYVTDAENNQVSEIQVGTGKQIVVDTGYNVPFGIAADASFNVYVADTGDNTVKKIVPSGGVFISPILPKGLAMDNGTGIISGNATVGSPATDYTVTAYNFAGKGSVTLNIGVIFPPPPTLSYESPAVYTKGIAISPLMPASTDVAGYGYSRNSSQVASGFQYVQAMAADRAGNLYVADFYDGVVKVPAGSSTHKKLGSGFSDAVDIKLDAAGNIYVCDVGDNTIKKIPAGGGATITLSSDLLYPQGLALDASGNIYVADRGHNAVKKIAADGSGTSMLGHGFFNPDGVAVDSQGNVYVIDLKNRLFEIKPAGNQVLLAYFTAVYLMAADLQGNVFVVDNGQVKELPAGSKQVINIPSKFSYLSSMAIDPQSNLLISDGGNVDKIEPAGGYFLSRALPPGLSFSNTTGTISGTPKALSPPTNYTITTYNIAGVASANVNIKVRPNANLASLKLSSGKLDPAFKDTTTTYTASVTNATDSISVTPTTSDTAAMVTVNGFQVASGTASDKLPLRVGANNIKVVVTADGGTTEKMYVIKVTRKPGNAYLSNLRLNGQTLSPAFYYTVNDYTAAVPYGIASVKVTPTVAVAGSTIKVNGMAVGSGTASGPIALAVGTNTIRTVVLAADGVSKNAYTVVVTRAPSANANLSKLALSTGTLSPAFASGALNYQVSVGGGITSVKIIPVTSDVHATVKVNGTTVASGAASGDIPLMMGANTIQVGVTAQDGVTEKTYTITVKRAVTPLNNLYERVSVEKPLSSPRPGSDAILVHQALSPNGDGQNDFLVIDGIAKYPDNKLTILDRNGTLVYEAKGYNNSSKVFDGHSSKSGVKQLPGTYFYSLEYTVKGVRKRKAGFIVLKY